MDHRRRPQTPELFTIDEARQHGLSQYRLDETGLEVPFRGLRVVPGRRVASVKMAWKLAQRDPSLVISHDSAAQLWGLWLPWRLREAKVNVARIRGEGGIPRFRGAQGHLLQARPEDLREWGGVRLTSPEWTWTDLAMRGLSLEELITAGDALLQRADGPPRPVGVLGRNPLATIEGIRAVIDRRRGIAGIRMLRLAVEHLRERVDSEPESRVRTRLVMSGWPEPEVNPTIVFPDGWEVTPDLVYRQWRLALQYEGEHHFSRSSQYRSDMHRDENLQERDWMTLRIDAQVFTPEGWRNFLVRLQKAADKQTRWS